MAFDQIRSWLERPGDYQTGLALLKKTGAASAFTLSILERGDDAYTHSRLTELLGQQLATEPAPIPPAPPAEPLPVLPRPDQPDLTQPLQQRAYQLMDERTDLKARIRAKMDDEDAEDLRREWALRIVQITQRIDALYGRIDFAHQHGYLLADDCPDEGDENPVLTLLNVRTYISRYRKRLSEAKTDEKRHSYAALLQRYEAEKERLERSMAAL